MKHIEQIKEIINSEVGRFAVINNYIFLRETNRFEEYEVSFTKEFSPIFIRAYSNGIIQVKVGDLYESVSTIDSTCCYLYVALMNAKKGIC